METMSPTFAFSTYYFVLLHLVFHIFLSSPSTSISLSLLKLTSACEKYRIYSMKRTWGLLNFWTLSVGAFKQNFKCSLQAGIL